MEAVLNGDAVDISKCYGYAPNPAARNKLAGILDSLVKRGHAVGKAFRLYVRPLCPGSLRKHMSLREVPIAENAIVDVTGVLGTSGICKTFCEKFAETARTQVISFPSCLSLCLET
jgi:hypothetical protein